MRISQCLINYVSNASKFTQAGSIGIQVIRDADHCIVSLARDENFMALSIRLDKDARLRSVMANLKTPLFVSYPDSPSVVYDDPKEFLNFYLTEKLRVRAESNAAPLDGTVRWIYPGSPFPDGGHTADMADMPSKDIGIGEYLYSRMGIRATIPQFPRMAVAMPILVDSGRQLAPDSPVYGGLPS